MAQMLEGVVSIICIFIVYKQITSDNSGPNEELNDPYMITVTTFFISRFLLNKAYYPVFVAFIAGGITLFVKKAINKKK